MLKEVGTKVKALLTAVSGIQNVEYYEGQFENFQEQVVNPPHLYLDYGDDEVSGTEEMLGSVTLHVYIMTTSLARTPNSMLDILELIITALHNKGIRDASTSAYLGRCFYKGSKPITTFDGLVIRDATFKVERS